jgi:DNA topoisomerase-1
VPSILDKSDKGRRPGRNPVVSDTLSEAGACSSRERELGSKLIFVDDRQPGFRRRRAGHGWAYFDAEGHRVTDRDEIDRLNRIALPPAYSDAWFCLRRDGHLLATGRDAKGRKQYRYHPDYRLRREGLKYDALSAFGQALPAIRRRVAKDLASRKLTRERAIACVIRLLDTGTIRIGNEDYARKNKSFGATTLRKRHADLRTKYLRLRFRAKSGKLCELDVDDRDLIRFVRAIQDLPGQHLFQFIGDDGDPSPVGSSDVNDYLREIAGEDFTAKHFRTWRASAIALELLQASPELIGMADLGAAVAGKLGNTPAIARKSYIHPIILNLAKDREAQRRLKNLSLPRATKWLSRHERGLLAILEKGRPA